MPDEGIEVLAGTSGDLRWVVRTSGTAMELSGLRFAAASLPEGEGPASMHLEIDGVEVERLAQPVPAPPR